jgi:predicted small secreted protein
VKLLDRLIAPWIVLVVSSGLALVGCNTVEGAGKDIKSAGKAIEEEAAEHH